MSEKFPDWYDPEIDGKAKDYLEWCFHEELEPDEEPGFYRPKRGSNPRDSCNKREKGN